MAKDQADVVIRSRQILWLVHGLGVMFVVIVFLLVVMTAVAQQEVISRIKDQQLNFGYGAALAINQDAQATLDEVKAIVKRQVQLRSQLDNQNSKAREAELRLEDDWRGVRARLQELGSQKLCNITIPAPTDIDGRDTAAEEVEDCSPPSDDPGANALTAAAKSDAVEFSKSARDYRSASRAAAVSSALLKDIQAEQAQLVLTPEQQKVSASFSEMQVLLKGWKLVGGLLVPFPPAMLQILLSFFSGLFGAVLVTLVLLVYPRSSFDITASKETWSRVFLGGLIALCVYIVLLGGTAVMGASNGFSGAGSNYMAFCGIGILAGMFSDRVAFWLSDRANVFFRRNVGPLPSPPAPNPAPMPNPPPPLPPVPALAPSAGVPKQP